MPYLKWNEKLSVGVKSLDYQHKTLIGALNKLHAAMLKGRAHSVIGELLSTLVKYTKEHFAAEEKLMKEATYPDAAEHKRQHDHLTHQVQAYLRRYEKGDLTMSVQLLSFLNNWISKHIQGDDHKYGPWLKSRGIS